MCMHEHVCACVDVCALACVRGRVCGRVCMFASVCVLVASTGTYRRSANPRLPPLDFLRSGTGSRSEDDTDLLHAVT